jgi:hypothetical protein
MFDVGKMRDETSTKIQATTNKPKSSEHMSLPLTCPQLKDGVPNGENNPRAQMVKNPTARIGLYSRAQ